MGEVSLRPATDADWQQIRAWLAEPDIQRWWGPSAASEAEVIVALGHQHAIARIVLVDGKDVGYGHAVDASVWGDDLPDSDSLRSHLYNLRRIVDRPFEQELIQTIPGRGFKLEEEVS